MKSWNSDEYKEKSANNTTSPAYKSAGSSYSTYSSKRTTNSQNNNQSSSNKFTSKYQPQRTNNNNNNIRNNYNYKKSHTRPIPSHIHSTSNSSQSSNSSSNTTTSINTNQSNKSIPNKHNEKQIQPLSNINSNSNSTNSNSNNNTKLKPKSKIKTSSTSPPYAKRLFKSHNYHQYTPSHQSPQKQWQMDKSPFQQDDFKMMDSDQQARVIANYLEKVPLLARLNAEDRYKLGKLFENRSYQTNEIVITQGDPGNEFFIIKEGEASVHIKNSNNNNNNNENDNKNNNETKEVKQVAVLKPGDYFGETSLLTDKPRNATIKAVVTLHTLVLDKDTFIAAFGKERIKVNFGKRGAVSSENGRLPSHLVSNRTKRPSRVRTQKDEDTKELIAIAVENNVLFAALDNDQVNRIVEVMWALDVQKGTNLIVQGEPGDNFYVVEKGTFDVYVKRNINDPNSEEKLVSTRTSGESFGELALMYNSLRSATVRARTDCKVWAVERYMFRKILIRVSEDKLQEYSKFLEKVPLLSSLLSNERRAVAEALDEVHFKEGDRIVEQGEQGDIFYIVKKGKAIVTKRDRLDQPPKEVLRLTIGGFFGERALIKNEARAATVTVIDGPMTCLCLDREAFCLLLGPLAELMHRKIDAEYDGKNMNIGYQNNNIGYQNQYGNNQNKNLNNLNSNQKKQAYQQQFIIKTELSTFEQKEDKNKLILKQKQKNSEPKQKLNIPKKELSTIGLLGKGSFGSVELVKHKKTNRTFALKTVSKREIVSTGQQEHILSEKKVMMMLDSPFIVKLFTTYNDSKYLYFLLEVVLGGELFTVLRSRTVFHEVTAKFYAASVVCAFEYMHSKNIIYRDLKPENVLLDNKGYLKITDFGFAKIVNDRTYTLCGTPDYLAPEVISGAGHGKGVDWWTLGILTFEMLASYPPFYDEDPMRTYAKIMYGKVKYPKHFTRDAIELIRGFLTAKSTKRLGVIKGGTNKIHDYKWFFQFDWNALKNGTMQAPIIPNVKSQEDRSNFETYHDDADGHEDDSYKDDGTNWDKDF